MHPYRTLAAPAPQLDVSTDETGSRLAFAVMTVVSAVQVVSAVVHGGAASPPALFGGACFLAGASWLRRHPVTAGHG